MINTPNISEFDISKINEILSKTDIYHISSFPWQAAAQDVGGAQHELLTGLRHKWMYGNTGFFRSLDNYSNTFKRVDEYFEYGDYSFTLRQKMNIVNEMLECGFNSNLPVHISISPRTTRDDVPESTIWPKINTLNLNDDSVKDWKFIIHPGQTRAQASVFTRTNLQNTLLYVNKDHNSTISMDSSKHITKIESVSQLIKYYKPSNNFDINKLTYEFSVSTSTGLDWEDGFKKHAPHDTVILKCMDIRCESETLHSSADYVFKSFKTMHNFYKLFSNNTFNIYSNAANAFNKLNVNGPSLFYNTKSTVNSETFEYMDRLDYTFNPSGEVEGYSRIFANMLFNKYGFDSGIFSETEAKLIKNYAEFLKTNEELLKDVFSQSNTCNFHLEYNKLSDGDISWNDLVQKNNFSGICLYIDKSVDTINDRDAYEFLFCINTDVAITRSEDDSVAIINCEHEYWKTGKNYKEWILPKSFYTP